jgi:serine/threonine protein kinase
MNQSRTANQWPTDPNEYEKTHLIGMGASAKVYIAKLRDGRECAVKLLDLESLIHDDVLDEIRKELQAMALCRHPNVISHYVSFHHKRQM